jgi:diguanylate cyclase (GGDEF)-like protein
VTTVLYSLSAALGTLVVVLLIVVLRRPREGGRSDVADYVARDMEDRMELMVRELSDALDRAKEEGRRTRFLADLAGSIDLDEVLTRTLHAATDLPGFDAAMVVLDQPEAAPLIATQGMEVEEAKGYAPPSGGHARTVSLRYSYGRGERGRDPTLIRGGSFAPLTGQEGETIGSLAVFWRGDQDPTNEELEAVAELAESSGPAIENARRFREARQLADIDALTGLHNHRYFHETLRREVARAQRYDRRLALIVLDLDDFKAINDKIGHLAGDAVLAQAAERVRDVVRSADIACRTGGDEFAVILPESNIGEAELLYQRIQDSVRERPFGQAGRLMLSAGLAELGHGDDATTLFQRADAALYRAKDAGKGQAAIASN